MPIDDYSNDSPDSPPNNPAAPGKYIKISVPDFMNTGSPSGMGSYLRLGAVEDLTKAGKAAGAVGLIVDLHGNPLTADPYAPVNPTYDPYAPFGPTNPPPGPPATTPNLPPPAPNAPNNPTAAGPDPTGEDLASLVQGFADDTRNRGVWTGTPGATRKDPGSTAQGPLYGWPWTNPVVDAKAPGQLDASPTGNTPPFKFMKSSKPVFFPTDYRTLESSQIHTKGGWRDHSDGNRITTTRGDKVEVIRGNYKLIVLGRQDQTKAKLAGMDISGGVTDTGDLSADASTDFNQGSTSFSSLSEWRQCATEANAGKQAQATPADIAALQAAAQAAQANADAKALIAQQLQSTADTLATAATAAQKAAQNTEDATAVAAANTAAAAAEMAAEQAAAAQKAAQTALNASNAAALNAKSTANTAASADAAAAAAQAQATTAAELAAAQPSPANTAAAQAAAAAAAQAQANASAADQAASAAAADAAAKKTASDNAAAAAKTAKANADAAAADAAAKATAAAQTANPGTLQAAIQAASQATNAQTQANNAATQAALAQAQADDARAKLLVVEAGLDATPLEVLGLWEDDGADPDYLSFSTSKGGSGPKVQVKYQQSVGDPVANQTPDGHTFTQPISMGVSISEKWSYQVYNYQGIGYYPLTIPQPQPYPPPKTQTMSKGGNAIDAPQRNPPPPDFPTLPEWQIYPVSKVVNKTYTWRQSSETFIEQQVTVTAGPRLDPAVANPEFPERTYPPDALGARLYDRDLLKAVLAPGAGPGAYNKVGSTWAETHVVDQKTWLRAVDTLNDTEVLGLQHSVTNVNESLSQSHYNTKTDETHTGTQTTETTIGTQTTTSLIGMSTAFSMTGMKTTMDITGLSTAVSITGVKSTTTITGVDMSVNMTGVKITATFGPLVNIEIPTKKETSGDTTKTQKSATTTTAGTNSHTAAAHKKQ